MCLVLGRRNICIARKQMIKPFFWRKFILFLILLILILHMDMDLSDNISTALNGVLDMQADSGRGLDSILPTSNVKCKTKRMKAYRAAIGLFHACKTSLNIGNDSRSDTFHDILITNLRCSFLFYFISYTSNIDIAYGYGFIRQNIYRTQRCTRYVSRLRSRIGFNITRT
jgi:hypothetical protein